MAMKIKEPSMLFEERVGVCNITLCLDKRNPDRAVDGQFPLCMRFTSTTGNTTSALARNVVWQN